LYGGEAAKAHGQPLNGKQRLGCHLTPPGRGAGPGLL
jgi:hypothetical protein